MVRHAVAMEGPRALGEWAWGRETRFCACHLTEVAYNFMLPRSSSRELIASKVVARVLRSLPEDLHKEAARCRIELCDLRACKEELPDEGLLGLFEGNTRADPLPSSSEELPRIRLFLDNLWNYSEGDVQAYREEVRTTLLHELGHFLGLDEDGVEALGLA